jgi:hypothetical protein
VIPTETVAALVMVVGSLAAVAGFLVGWGAGRNHAERSLAKLHEQTRPLILHPSAGKIPPPKRRRR